LTRDKEERMPWIRSLAVALAVGAAAAAADWPQWLGPTRDGVSTEKVKPWKGDLRVLWRRPVGEGHSSPVVAGGRVFLHTKVAKEEKEALSAFDAATGKPLWTTAYDRAKYGGLFGAGPRGTPAVVGDRVYAHGITGVLSCFKTDDGRLLWQVDTLKQFQGKNLFFGASGSPLVEGNLVLVNVGAQGAAVVAFDKDNGNTVWQKLDDGGSYSSPIAFGEGKSRQVVFLTQAGLVSLRPGDGEVFWRVPFKDKLTESSTTPVRAGDLLIGSSITLGSVALRLGEKDGKPAVEEVWRKPKLTCYFSTPVPAGGALYLVTGQLGLGAVKSTLHCVDPKTGKGLWQRAGVGKYHACLLRTGDGKLLLLEEGGGLALLEPDAKQYRELARTTVCGETWAHPALADGRLYVRDKNELVCVQLPAQ
jgi:outer membrane protein assembly factor BamB